MLLVLDECQTGLGRLGAMYGFEVYGVVPDCSCCPRRWAGACRSARWRLAPRSRRSATTRGFVHVTSHVSDPMPAAAARAVIDVVVEEGLAARARSRGEYLLAGLRELQERHEHIGDVRGLGLLCGLELVEDRSTREPADALGLALTDECQRCGLSINLVRGGTGGQASCLRMAPPLTVAEDEIDLAVTIIDEALHTVTQRRAADVASSPGRL